MGYAAYLFTNSRNAIIPRTYATPVSTVLLSKFFRQQKTTIPAKRLIRNFPQLFNLKFCHF